MSEPGREQPEPGAALPPPPPLPDFELGPAPELAEAPPPAPLPPPLPDFEPEPVPMPAPEPLRVAAPEPAAPEQPEKPEKPPWRWGTWILIAALVWLWYGLADPLRKDGVVESTRLVEAGALVEGAQARSRDAWRLVEGTFVHGRAEPLVFGVFLLLVAGSAVERMVGRGPLLFLFVVGGAAANAVRAALESTRSLQLMAGAWPAAVVLAGAAVSLAARQRRPVLPVLLALLFVGALLLTMAGSQGIAAAPLQVVLAAAVTLGLLLGLLLRPRGRPGEAELQGCLFSLLAVTALGLGGIGRHASQPAGRPRRPPPPWSAPPPAPEVSEGLEVRSLETLGIQISLPAGWRQNPAVPECPRCGQDMPGGEAKRACPGCGKEVKPRDPMHLLFFARGDGRRVRVVSFPRGPFDGPDTEVVRTLARLAKNPRASGFEDLVQLEERSFPGALGHGHLAVLETRLAQGNEQLVWRMYGFVGAKRTVRVDGFHAPRADPREEEADVGLFDAIAASVKELGE